MEDLSFSQIQQFCFRAFHTSHHFLELLCLSRWVRVWDGCFQGQGSVPHRQACLTAAGGGAGKEKGWATMCWDWSASECLEARWAQDSREGVCSSMGLSGWPDPGCKGRKPHLLCWRPWQAQSIARGCALWHPGVLHPQVFCGTIGCRWRLTEQSPPFGLDSQQRVLFRSKDENY